MSKNRYVGPMNYNLNVIQNLDHKVRASCSLRSCSSGYSDGSAETAPAIDRQRKPRFWSWETPPPDVTLTLHRESAV